MDSETKQSALELDFFENVEDISSTFNKAQKVCLDYENTMGEGGNPYEETIKNLKKVEKSIIYHGLFSPNEDFKEVLTEHIKYLLLPFYIGDTFGRMSIDRKKNLLISKIYLNEFVKLIDHYGILPKELKTQWKTLSENPKAEPSREDKISSFKDKKALENKLNNLESIKDEQDQRDLVHTHILLSVHKTVSQLRLIHQEIEILEYKEKLEKDKNAKETHDKLMGKPIPKMKIQHIPKPQIENQPFMVSDMKSMCHSCDSTKIAEIRRDLEKKVWQPGFGQPYMTMDEWFEGEQKIMQEMEDSQKRANERQKMEEEEDSDDDEVNEKRTLKARNWDDWKDENEKGAGNKMGK